MIEQLIAETTDCDFKEAVEHAKPKSWLKSVSAFANTKGGTLVFGVSDENHEVVGLQDAQADADFISQTSRWCATPASSVRASSAIWKTTSTTRTKSKAACSTCYARLRRS